MHVNIAVSIKFMDCGWKAGSGMVYKLNKWIYMRQSTVINCEKSML